MIADEKRKQYIQLVNQCRKMNADVIMDAEQHSAVISVPPPWDATSELTALQVQQKIKEMSQQYPDVICYCFDSFSTLLYVLQ